MIYIVKGRVSGTNDYCFGSYEEALEAFNLLNTCEDEEGPFDTGAYQKPQRERN